jgi:regulation of enolase protein 1 (concanavalin A-like superfamily)
MPLPENPASICCEWCGGDHVEAYISTDGERYTMLRLAYLAPSDTAMIGPMCCSPDGDGFTVRFEGFRVTPA